MVRRVRRSLLASGFATGCEIVETPNRLAFLTYGYAIGTWLGELHI